jgi:hypothetical protein
LSLSSVQKFRVDQIGHEAHIWQATLDPYVSVWTTYPAARDDEGQEDGPRWWTGNASQPRVVQYEDALICIYDSTLLSYVNFKYGHRSHAWFPIPLFDDWKEVREGINAERGGVWFFGMRGDAYVGLFSAHDEAQIDPGRWSQREIRCDTRVNVWVCQVGSKSRFGDFEQFVTACTQARIHIGKGVYQPSNPLVDIQCSYDIPGKRRLSVNLEDRWPAFHGHDFSDEDFPHFDNPWTTVPWNQRDYVLTAPPDATGFQAELHHDCVSGVRTGHGV